MAKTLTLKKPGAVHRPAPQTERKPPAASPDELKRARAWLREQLPDRETPFVVGIKEQLQARRPADIGEAALRIVLNERTRDLRYLLGMLTCEFRQGLNGERLPIEEAHRVHAAERLLRMQADGTLDKVRARIAARNEKPRG